MNDVGEKIMIEFLESFLKHEKININITQSEYTKIMNYEILICDDFKVLHIQDSTDLSIHYNGSIIPIAIKQLNNS